MKKAALILLLLALAAAAGAGYLFLTCRVSVRSVTVATVEASAQPEQFDQLRRQMENDAVDGILYGTADLSDASRYQFAIMGVDANWQKVVKGVVLLAAVVFDILAEKKTGKA